MKTNMKTNNSIDLILDIQGTYTVLIQRGNDPDKGMWALPGGRIKGGGSLEKAVIRELKEETGIDMNLISEELPYLVSVFGEGSQLEQVQTYATSADPRGGTTTLYAVQVKTEPDEIEKRLINGDDAIAAKVFNREEIPRLAFDHNRLITDYFTKLKKYQNPIPTVDIFIEYKDGIVIIERKNDPKGLALPGGFAEKGLTLEENAIKEAKEETNLDIEIINPGRPFVYSNPSRDPRNHLISNTFIAKGSGELKAGDDAKNAYCFGIPKIKELVYNSGLEFDHCQIIKDVLELRGYNR